MLSTFLIFVLCLVSVVFICLKFGLKFEQHGKRRGKRLPGPPSLPFVGCLPFLIPFIGLPNYEIMRRLGKKYGGFFAGQIGLQYCLHVDDYNLAREIMSSEEYRNRFNDHPSFYERSFNQQIGLALANGEGWKEIRKFTTKSLRQFGFGKEMTVESSLACELEIIMGTLCDQVDKNQGQGLVNMHLFFNVAVLNLLWTMMVGVRFSHEDEKLHKLLHLVDSVSKSAPQGLTPAFAFPFLRYIPNLTEHDMVLELHRQVQNLFREIIEERRKEGAFLDNPSDFIDVFLLEIHNRRQHAFSSDSPNHYTDEQLMMVCTDLFFTGSDTSSTALQFAFLYMILNPEVQAKVQEEIDNVVGRERLPNLEDRKRMPYTEAVTMEVLRVSSILPLTGRCPLEDTMINEYFVPKGTIVGINLYSIHYSEKLWENPYEFNPGRFLNENNEVINGHKIMPFGFGKRLCMGETMARATIFTFFTSLLQKYKFTQEPGAPPPSTVPISGFTQYPRPYKALVTMR